MKVFRDISSARDYLSRGAALTIGNYDGIHVGHQTIIKETVEQAGRAGLRSALVTFDPHPHSILIPDRAPRLLTTTDEKLSLLEQTSNLDATIVLHFDRKLAEVTAEQFLQEYLMSGLSCQVLVIGFNHAFGHNREGNVAYLNRTAAQHKFQLVTLEPILIGGEPVNSSRVRREMIAGDFNRALNMLGHEFGLRGRVVRGRGIGRSLGFPTINVKVQEEKIVPQTGVYAAYSIIGSEKRHGMMYIGESAGDFDLEVNLFDFDGELYGSEVKVVPTQYIRPSMRFRSERDLVDRIREDERQIRLVFNIV